MNKQNSPENIVAQTPGLGRRDLLKLTGAGVAALGVGSLSNASNAKAQSISGEWDKVFPRSEKVDHEKVTFKNRYGITLAADLYQPKNRASRRLAALAISGPFGAVKEQSSGLYAQTMAERGFVTLAFDPSYTGESGGEPRNVASPDINTEDFSAAVDFLGLHPSVDRERIGVIGICGWGGMALNAVAVDKRVKAVAASTMYDMTRVMSRGHNDSVTVEQRTKTLEKLRSEEHTSELQSRQYLVCRLLLEKITASFSACLSASSCSSAPPFRHLRCPLGPLPLTGGGSPLFPPTYARSA